MGILFYKLPSTTMALRYMYDEGFSDPTPLTPDQLIGAAKDIEERTISEGEHIHDRIVLKGNDYFAWWCPKKRRRITIDNSSRKTFNHPPLFFHVKNYQLSVYEMAINRRPTLNTILYRPRYRGIDVHGNRVGQCNVRVPDTMQADPIPWEDSFFMSRFNSEPHKKRQSRQCCVGDFL